MPLGCLWKSLLREIGNRRFNILASGSHQRVTCQKGWASPLEFLNLSLLMEHSLFTPIESKNFRTRGLEILLSDATFFIGGAAYLIQQFLLSLISNSSFSEMFYHTHRQHTRTYTCTIFSIERQSTFSPHPGSICCVWLG